MGGSLEAFKIFQASEKRKQERYEAHLKAQGATNTIAQPAASADDTTKNVESASTSTGTSDAGSPVQKASDPVA